MSKETEITLIVAAAVVVVVVLVVVLTKPAPATSDLSWSDAEKLATLGIGLL